MSSWNLETSSYFASKLKAFRKRCPRETVAVLNNLDTYMGALNSGTRPALFQAGFIHRDSKGHVMGNKYRSVTDLITAETGDEQLVSELQQEIDDTRLAKTLVAMRTGAGITQGEIGAKLGRTQGAISKLEHAGNDAIKVSDLVAYADALGLTLSISFQKDVTAAESVKYHAFQIQKHLDHLATLAHRDDDILEGVKRFFSETLYNVLRLIGASLEKLPQSGIRRGSVLEVTSPGETRLQQEPSHAIR